MRRLTKILKEVFADAKKSPGIQAMRRLALTMFLSNY